MEIYKQIKRIISKSVTVIDKHYFLFLLLVLLFSYGQMLLMYVWKDDNAIFFKFTHLAEPAGYLGRGLWGEGPYRLSVAPYWFIYRIFGYSQIIPFYVFALIFYFFATLAVYFLSEGIFSKNIAKISAFIFASGYLASEGFYWLASSWILSSSILLTLIFVLNYFKYVTTRRALYYWLALLFYLLSVVITPVRVHYTVALVLILEIVWLTRNRIRALVSQVIRSLPFLLIFYYSFVLSADSRTSAFSDLFKQLGHGDLYVLYSFFGTIGNIIIPDKLWSAVFDSSIKAGFPFWLLYFVIYFISLLSILFLIPLQRKYQKFITGSTYSLLVAIWCFLSYKISHYPQVSSVNGNPLLVFCGGVFLLFLLTLLTFKIKGRKELLFFLTWFILSLFVYTAYIPTSIYASIDRYLGHSFVALIGVFMSILYSVSEAQNAKKRNVFLLFLVSWAALNIYFSYKNQNNIIKGTSIPAKNFYLDLKKMLPVIAKGDLIYIDIASDSRNAYAGAFSVGQMPESTAIAWRYNLDRYDFGLINSYEDIVKNSKEYPNLHAFAYKNQKLIDITQQISSLKSKEIILSNWMVTADKKDNSYFIHFDKPITSVLPLKIELKLSSIPKRMPDNTGKTQSAFFETALDYVAYYKRLKLESTYNSSSEWQERKISNIFDGNLDTAWQADRILWHEGREAVIVDLKKVEEIDRVAIINGFEQNSPTQFEIESSVDQKEWSTVYSYKQSLSLSSNQIYDFAFPATKARYIKMTLQKSLNDDSPGITEFWPILSKFKEFSIKDLEKFRTAPSTYIKSNDNLQKYLISAGNTILFSYSWLKDDKTSYESTGDSRSFVISDNKIMTVSLRVPAGGLELSDIKLHSFTVPLDISIKSMKILYSDEVNEK